MIDRPLPTALEAERVTLRSILLDPLMLPVVLRIVDYGDFYDEQYRAIYRTIVRHHIGGQPVDAVLVAQELRGSKLFPETGKSIATVLCEIAAATSTAAHAEHYANIVARVGQRRRAILQTTAALDRLWRNDDASKVLSDLRGDIEELQVNPEQAESTCDQFDRWAQGIIRRERQQVFRFAPHGSDIGKFQFGPGEVTLIGAPPAAGKSALCGQVVFDALRFEGQEHLRLLIANVEMSAAALLTRQLARASTVSYSYLHHRDYCEDAKPRIEVAIEELRGLMPRVEFMRAPFTLEHLRQRAKGIRRI